MARRLSGKVAIITGASRGLGQYCALEYGREGAIVAVAARTEQETDPRLPGTIYSTAKLVDEAGGEGFPVVCNVADPASIDAMVAKVMDRYGRIDILMTNAGISPPGGVSTIQPKHWDLEWRINVHGTFHCIRAVLPTMQAQRSGNIITISSVAARADYGGHYGATKRAVEAITIGLANELRDQGIAVNSLKPVSRIETPGMHVIRPGGAPIEPDPTIPPKDGYIEAAVLLALQTPATCTGGVFYDNEAIDRLADEATKARLAYVYNR
ncbi:MAG: SDR family NAD(P)-dependent oxidoreductase [Dehalococcoidia bacterium]